MSTLAPARAGSPPDLATGTRRAPYRIGFPVLCVFALMCAAVAIASSQPVHRAMAITVGFILFTIWATRYEKRRWGPRGLVSPLSICAIFWTIYIGILGLGSFATVSSDSLIGNSSRPLSVAMATVLASLVLLTIPYTVITRPRPTPARTTTRPVTQLNVRPAGLLALFGVGWAATFYEFSTGHVGYLGYGGAVQTGVTNRLLALAVDLVPLGIAILGFALWSAKPLPSLTRRTAAALLALNLPLLVISTVSTGVKGLLLTDLIPLGAIYVIQRRRVPWKAIALVGLYGVLFFGGVQQLRTQISTGQITGTQKLGLFNVFGRTLGDTATSWSTHGPVSQFQTVWRSATAEYEATTTDLATIIHLTPSQVPYLSPVRYLAGPLFFVPTSMIPGAAIPIGSYTSVHYMGSTATTSTPTTQPGDFYISGSWIGVIIGELAVGLFLGAFWRYVAHGSASDRRILLYCALVPFLANAGLDWTGLTRGILQALVVDSVVLWVVLSSTSVTPLTSLPPAPRHDSST